MVLSPALTTRCQQRTSCLPPVQCFQCRNIETNKHLRPHYVYYYYYIIIMFKSFNNNMFGNFNQVPDKQRYDRYLQFNVVSEANLLFHVFSCLIKWFLTLFKRNKTPLSNILNKKLAQTQFRFIVIHNLSTITGC